MERMRPCDHFPIPFETEKSPIKIGGLLVFDVPQDRRKDSAQEVRARLEANDPKTMLARRPRASPDHHYTDAWFRMSAAGALRSHLARLGQRPATPLISHSVCSIRQPERGL